MEEWGSVQWKIFGGMGDASGAVEKQVPPLRYGMTNKKDNYRFFALRYAQGSE